MLGSGPVYAALGNHDSYNECVDAFSSANLTRLISTIATKTRLNLSVGSSLSNLAGNKPVTTFTSRDFSLHPRNYDHVAGLWAHEKWLPEAAVQQARSHYAAFSVKRVDGLRVIALNTDFWYKYVAQSYEKYVV